MVVRSHRLAPLAASTYNTYLILSSYFSFLQMQDHAFTKRRNLTQNTKKMDCPATIYVKHVVKFSDFKVSARFPKK